MNMNILDTGIKTIKNVQKVLFGKGSFNDLNQIINSELLKFKNDRVIIFIDHFFQNKSLVENLNKYEIVFVDTTNEPKTSKIDSIMEDLRRNNQNSPAMIVGIGGGSTLDTAKACSNLFNNSGKASDYQGWDKLKNPGVFKIGIPTISGTGSESTRTCVMTNSINGLKLGMNSDFSVFDYIILDPDLTKSVSRDQFFFTGMDAYIHCIESLDGNFRNSIGDSYSNETLKLCNDVFLSENMMSFHNREKLMVASYLGGCSIATSYVGLIHPFSAGLSVVLGIHHCEANCIVMNSMEEFYPIYHKNFKEMVKKQNISIKKGIANNLTDLQYHELYKSTIIHEKPLYNALGDDYKKILNKNKVIEIFKKM